MASLFDLINGGNSGQADAINQLYAGQMGRAPDPAGCAYWGSALQGGMDPRAMAQAFFMSPEATARASGTHGMVLPKSQDQQNWQDHARQSMANINQLPFVLNPDSLSSDPAANKQMMYPSITQPGGVAQVNVGGQNIGPTLSQQGMDPSGMASFNSMDDLAAFVAQKYGKTQDEAKTMLMGIMDQLKNAQGGAAPTATKPVSTPDALTAAMSSNGQ